MSRDSAALARSLNDSSGEQRILNYQSFYGGIWIHPGESPLIEQRWNQRKERWRSDSTVFDPKTHYVAPLPQAEANAFVARNHYLGGGIQAAIFRVGLFSARTPRDTLQDEARPTDRLVGAAIFADAESWLVRKWAPGLTNRRRGTPPLKLARLVLNDEVAFNGETWFLGAALKLMRQGYRRPLTFHSQTPWTGRRFSVLLSLSDPVPHVLPGKKVVMPGHIGRVYQAFNGSYRGRTKPGDELWTPEGVPLSGLTISKIGTERSGKGAAVGYLERATGVLRQPGEALGRYRKRATDTALESGDLLNISHPGKHVYLWPLGGGVLDDDPRAEKVRRFYERRGPQRRDLLELQPPGGAYRVRGIAPEIEPLGYAGAVVRWTDAKGERNKPVRWGWVHPLLAYFEGSPRLSVARRKAAPFADQVLGDLQAGRVSLEDARIELTRINSILDHRL